MRPIWFMRDQAFSRPGLSYRTFAAGAFPPAPAISSSASHSNPLLYILSFAGEYDVPWTSHRRFLFWLIFPRPSPYNCKARTPRQRWKLGNPRNSTPDACILCFDSRGFAIGKCSGFAWLPTDLRLFRWEREVHR